MDDAGDNAPATAMGMMIIDTAAGVKILHYLLSRGIEAKTKTWRSAVST
jgi:iron(III) transport system permease protein